MKRFIAILLTAGALAACDKSAIPAEFVIETEAVTGSRARITVAAKDPLAYYSWVAVDESQEYFNDTAEAICDMAIQYMEESLEYFPEIRFTDMFCYRGSRQFNLTGRRPDTNFKFVFFQIHPQTHKVIGEPIVIPFKTKPVPTWDLTFQIDVEGSVLTIIPSDNSLTYFWEYENTELILNKYGDGRNYLYTMAGMYQEYGFMENEYSKGKESWNIETQDSETQDGEACTLIICGCADGEFTTGATEVDFIYHPGNVEVLSVRYPRENVEE